MNAIIGRSLGAVCLVVAIVAGPATAQVVRPQFSVEDLQRQFGAQAATPPATPATGCRNPGATGADCETEPQKNERGFSLPTRGGPSAAPSQAAPARPKTGSTGVTRPTTSTPSTQGFSMPVRGVDLLLSFENGSAVLTPQARANAEVFAQFLTTGAQASTRFLIEGHTNSVGSKASNQTLSEARAKALADFLAQRGVDRSRLEVTGYGFERPIPGTASRAAANRRVEARRLGS